MNESKITRDFGDIAFYTEGSGPYLLGLSGFGCSHYNFIDLVPELKKHFTVVLVDNRATGKSSGTKEDYKIVDLAKDALAVMDHLKADQFFLAGISMGGFIAQELVKLAPQRVKALSLMCTTSGTPTFDHPKKLTEADLRASAAWPARDYAEFMTRFTTHESLEKNDPERFQRIINLRLESPMDLEEKIRQNRAAVNFIESEYDLTKISCPTYAVAGATDRFLSPTFPAMFEKVIPNCKSELIPETDHYFFLEKPKLVADKLTQFFQGTMS